MISIVVITEVMKNNSKYYNKEELIVRYLSGDLSEIEKQEFETWLNKNPENKNLFEDFKKLWNHSQNLSAIESINVTEDWQKTKQKFNFKRDEKTHSLPVKRINFNFWRVAATLIILLGIGLLSKQYLFTSPEMILVESGNFKQYITLPDGSTVFLNNNSSLEYPEKFKRKERLVSLCGEAFFEVAKNPDKKFQVNIDKQAFVEILGTSFNIKSEIETGNIAVNVVTGKVAFYTPDKEKNKTLLTKNENAVLKNGTISKNIRKDKNFLSWRTGVLYFEDEKIENVCKTLSKCYNRQIIAEGLENSEIRFTSIIDNQNLESVLEEMKLVLNIDYSIKEQRIIFHKPEKIIQ